jgi:hypothetical protein
MKTFDSFAIEEELFDDLDELMEIDEEFFDELYDLTEEEDFSEAVMTVAQRRKRGRLFKRLQPRIQRAKARKQKRLASKDALTTRANKSARNAMRKRLSANKPYASLSPAAKIAIDKKVEKKGAAIKRLAKRLLPGTVKKERQRLKSFRANKSASK